MTGMHSAMVGSSLYGISRPVETTGAKALLASWRELVYKCIADLKSKYPRSNDSQLAARIRVNRTSFIRFTSEIQKPQLENYLKLVVGSGNGHLASDALRLYDEDLGKVFEGVFEQLGASKHFGDASKRLENLLNDHKLYIPFVLCLKSRGTTILEVEDVLGKNAQPALNELVSLDLVKIVDGKYIVSETEDLRIAFSRTTRHQNIKQLIDLYKPRRSDQHVNYSFVVTEGLSQEGVVKVKEKMDVLYRELSELFRDEKYKGDIPFFATGVCDTFTTEIFEKVRKMNEGGAE